MHQDREYGHVRAPRAEEIQDYARRHHIVLGDDEAGELVPILAQLMTQIDVIDELTEPPAPPLRHTDRDPGHAPASGEDPHNALTRVCRVSGAPEGSLHGTTAVVKDSIAVAGVPMTYGSRMLPVFTPWEDAVAVERILDEGATIVGKTNMENMGWGSGQASAFGSVRNPVDPEFTTGGSSSGSAAAVAAGDVDFALGADEAGSIRIPSAMCGLVGMKGTHGLVPSYGMTYFDHTLDHIGPITRDIELNARVLNAIAGSDPRDPQWKRSTTPPVDCTGELDAGVDGLVFRVVEEALAWSSDGMREAFERGCDRLRAAGARVETVSFPLWEVAWTIETTLLAFSSTVMLESGGSGYFHLGRIDPNAVATMASQARNSPRDLPVMLQINLLMAEHLRDHYLGVHYAKAQNLRLELTRQIDDALDGAMLLTPTTPNVADARVPRRHSFPEIVEAVGGDSVLNTCPMDITGHPALTVPCGRAEHDLPAGIQIVGGRFSEATLYRAGRAAMA